MYNLSGITIEELLNLDIMEKGKLLAGKKGIKNIITKVNVMEVPDIINWVEEGEFLLTTAYSFKDDLQGFRDLVIHLNKKGLAGLGIKTKRYIEEVPSDVLKIADEIGFPLIEISYELSYSTIITKILTEIINNQTNKLYRIDNMHNKLLNIMLSNGGLKEIAEALYESIDGNSLAIIDYLFETSIIMSSQEEKQYIQQIIEKDSNKIRKNIEKNKCVSRDSVVDYFGDKKITRKIIPISTSERCYGCIYIWESQRECLPVELTVIESATPIVALDSYKKLSVFEIDTKYRSEFFDDLLSNDKDRYKKAMEVSSYFNFKESLKYAVMIISINLDKKYDKFDPKLTDYLYQINRRLFSIIKRIIKNNYPNLILGNKSNKLILLYGEDSNILNEKIKKDINRFCEEIINYAKFESILDNIKIGIGNIYKDPMELWKSYNEANKSVEYLNREKNKKIAYFNDLGVHRILFNDEIKSDLNHIYIDLLGDLIKYDNEKGTDFIETLNNYFKYGGNLKRISSEMFTHYNTVIYRIQRIKEITGVDFEDYDDRLNLQLALKIHDTMKSH